MDTLFDIDPQIVEAVLARADDFLEAQRRVDEIIKNSEQKVAHAERALSNQLKAGVSEETAVEEYVEASKKVRVESEALLQELTKEYQMKFPAAEKVE